MVIYQLYVVDLRQAKKSCKKKISKEASFISEIANKSYEALNNANSMFSASYDLLY